MSNNNMAKAYVSVRGWQDGRTWQYSVPEYVGKIAVGDVVVVGEPQGGCLALGEVVSIDPCAAHRSENIWPIVDKVKVGRWRRGIERGEQRAQLMKSMATRQAELDALSRYGESANSDAAMKEYLAKYSELS